MNKVFYIFLVCLMVFSISCGKKDKDTFLGTPRNETLIVDILNGRAANPNLLNPFVLGSAPPDAGLHQLLRSHLYEINTQTGEQFPSLAAEMPIPLNDDYTEFDIKLREGLMWSDGVEFTADDVVFTAEMLKDNKKLIASATISSVVKNISAVDKYTVRIETYKPEPKLSQRIGPVIWGNFFIIVAKHIWEKEDPLTFQDTTPVTLTPYNLMERDTEGYWFLYERREDWQNTDVGRVVGKEPGPKYILFRFFGNEEKRIIAAATDEIDILQDITPESWDILRARNKYIKAWSDTFPYAMFDDPCQRGILFNLSVPPYDNKDVRWALALAMDIKDVSLATFNGMMRVSPIQAPPTEVLQNTYHRPMISWLKEFELDDGYKPFSDSYAMELVELLKEQNIEDLPTSEEDIVNTFGVGWWKYDPDKAAELLEKHGFKKDDNGKWLLPNGKKWQITIAAPSNFEIQSMRLAFAVADAWNKFGIDTTVQQMDTSTFWTAESAGSFEVGSYWPSCGVIPDISDNLSTWHKRFVVPAGENSAGNRARWSNDKASQLIDEALALPSDDPRVIGIIEEILKEFAAEIPFLPMFGTSKFVPVNTYYWEGFQNIDNNFEGPWWWWSQFKFYTPHFKPTGR